MEVSDFDSEHDYIDFVNYQTEEELKRALIKLNLEPYLDGCAWCAVPCQNQMRSYLLRNNLPRWYHASVMI